VALYELPLPSSVKDFFWMDAFNQMMKRRFEAEFK
jgi:hypothetical protein